MLKYIMPMQHQIDGSETPDVCCDVDVDERNVCEIKADGYETKYMLKEYLDWLVYTGWAKIATERKGE